MPAPTGKAPPGSHWHYHTDPVKQTKCWYVRSDGEAAQPAAATDGAEAAGGPPRPAAAPKPAADAANPAGAHPHKPRQAAHAPTSKPSQAAQNPAAAPAGQGAAAWPDPQPQSPNGAPPPQAAQSGTAWPDPPQQSQGGADNTPWPDPPAPALGAAGDPATTSATPDASSVQDTGSTNPTGAGDTAAEAVQTPPASGSDVSGRTILALAIAIIFVAILMRWLVGRFFARRRRVAAERREPLWETDDYVMPDALTRGEARRPPDHIDPERLDAEAKLALRKLLRTLERSAA